MFATHDVLSKKGTGGSDLGDMCTDGGALLDTLRIHPEFNCLKRLVQNNHGSIKPKLTQIGQEEPQLMRAINQNKHDFPK